MKLEAFEHPQFGRYYQIGDLALPSVTTVLAATRPAADAEALRQWAEQVGAEQANAVRSSAAERGTRLHTLIERRLNCQHVQRLDALDLGVLPWWDSVLPVLKDIQSVHFLEHTVHHPHFCYAGSLDLVASVNAGDGQPGDGERLGDPGTTAPTLVLIDWKTSGRPKQRSWLGDHPLQLAAYWHALLATHPCHCSEAWIVLAHPQGAAQVHRFDSAELGRAWCEWLARLGQFWEARPEHPLSAQGLQAIQERPNPDL